MNIDGVLTTQEINAYDSLVAAVTSASSAVGAVGYGLADGWTNLGTAIPSVDTQLYYRTTWEPEYYVGKDDWDALKQEVAELRCLVEELLAQPTEKMGDIQDVL